MKKPRTSRRKSGSDVGNTASCKSETGSNLKPSHAENVDRLLSAKSEAATVKAEKLDMAGECLIGDSTDELNCGDFIKVIHEGVPNVVDMHSSYDEIAADVCGSLGKTNVAKSLVMCW